MKMNKLRVESYELRVKFFRTFNFQLLTFNFEKEVFYV